MAQTKQSLPSVSLDLAMGLPVTVLLTADSAVQHPPVRLSQCLKLTTSTDTGPLIGQVDCPSPGLRDRRYSTNTVRTLFLPGPQSLVFQSLAGS